MKASFTTAKQGAKASIRYIQHRPGKENTRVTRTLFGSDGQMSKEEAYHMIDTAHIGSVFFRFVLSPDPAREDTTHDLYLRQITEHMMQTLEARLHTTIAWVGTVHADHAPHRHVHVVAVVAGRLQKHDLQFLRESATAACLAQRQARDLAQSQQEEASWERSV